MRCKNKNCRHYREESIENKGFLQPVQAKTNCREYANIIIDEKGVCIFKEDK
jgi:hypothetical protein